MVSPNVDVRFTLHGVANIDDATTKATRRLTSIGITDDKYHVGKIDVHLYVASESRSVSGESCNITWDADVQARGYKK